MWHIQQITIWHKTGSVTTWLEIFQGQDPVSQAVLFFNTADIRHKLKTNLSNKAFRFNFLSAYSFRNLWRSFTACAVTPTGRSNEKHLYKKLTLCLPSCMNKNIISKFRNTNLCYSQNFYFDLYNISWFEDLPLDFLTGEKYVQNTLKPQKPNLNKTKGYTFIFNILFQGSCSRLLFERSVINRCDSAVYKRNVYLFCSGLSWLNIIHSGLQRIFIVLIPMMKHKSESQNRSWLLCCC